MHAEEREAKKRGVGLSRAWVRGLCATAQPRRGVSYRFLRAARTASGSWRAVSRSSRSVASVVHHWPPY